MCAKIYLLFGEELRMVLASEAIETDTKQQNLEKEIIRIISKQGSIFIPELVGELSKIDPDNNYFYQTALINLLSSGRIDLTLDRKLIISN